MPDSIVCDGDMVTFVPAFGAAHVQVQMGRMRGTGGVAGPGKKSCVEGDEKGVVVAGCAYTTPVFTIPGTGTLRIAELAVNQKALQTKSGGKRVILKGGTFVARFEVQSPAKQPLPPGAPIPDSVPVYPGTGQFVTPGGNPMGT